MRKRHPNHRLVKIHRNYTVEEVTRLFGIHKHTVRAWVKAGLPVCDNKRPMLILGRQLSDFLQQRGMKNKRSCRPGEIYCMRCRAPKRPAGDMAEYTPSAVGHGTLMGICPECDRMIYQQTSLAKLATIQQILTVTITEASQRLSDRGEPFVNSAFSEE